MNQPASVQETPLVILIGNRKAMSIGIWILVLIIPWSIFGIILPVLTTGDYNSVWPASTVSNVRNILMFYLAWIVLLFAPVFLVLTLGKAGTYYFYSDRAELRTYWIKRKLMIPYNRMHVIRRSGRILMTAQSLPSWSHPLLRFKEEYWNSLFFATIFDDPKIAGMKAGLTRTWENPEDGPKVLEILKERAFSFIEK